MSATPEEKPRTCDECRKPFAKVDRAIWYADTKVLVHRACGRCECALQVIAGGAEAGGITISAVNPACPFHGGERPS